MDRVQKVKTILWTIVGLAVSVAAARLLFGLGAITNLTDATPWGFWIGFDVMGGVALASGGFVTTAFFYIFKREEFHPLVKPAVLTAFLGYIAVVIGLLFDLGLPWNIWHMIIFWNPHSPLFEVGWCVMLYTTVLLLEFSPVPLEEFSRYAKIRSFLMRFRLPFVIIGIALSTLHQSSLGSLFLIMPFRLHPLWYSQLLPIQFFMSAIALGMMMVALESVVSHWLYRRAAQTSLIAKLGKAVAWVLGIYLVVRVIDIASSGELGLIFAGSWESVLFIIEMLISTIIPLILFAIPALRRQTRWQVIGSAMVVLGMVFNRLNVGGLTMLSTTGDSYVPSWMELSLSIGIVAAAGLVFLFAIERLHIWDRRPQDEERLPFAPPRFDVVSSVWLGNPGMAARLKYSLAFVLAFSFGLAVLPWQQIESRGVPETGVDRARGGDTLIVDGNRDGYGVVFAHKKHIETTGGQEKCVLCHHLNLPDDKQSGCYQCHQSMYSTADAFRHDWHAAPDGGKVACSDCHDSGTERTAASAKQCQDCHTNLLPPGATIVVDDYEASSYTDAMHILCVTCHKEKAIEVEGKQALAECASCHGTLDSRGALAAEAPITRPVNSGSVLLPTPKLPTTQSE
jgi:Ni/Fe-hydrogenase subunit HybB-like protein